MQLTEVMDLHLFPGVGDYLGMKRHPHITVQDMKSLQDSAGIFSVFPGSDDNTSSSLRQCVCIIHSS